MSWETKMKTFVESQGYPVARACCRSGAFGRADANFRESVGFTPARPPLPAFHSRKVAHYK
jgi:hypothetical protein